MSSRPTSNKSSQQPVSAEPTTADADVSLHVPADSADARGELSPDSGSTDTMISATPPIEPVGGEQPAPRATTSADVEIDLSYRAPPSISWRSLPLRDEGAEGLLIPLLAGGLGWLTYLSTGSPITSIVVVVALLGVWSRGFLPTIWEVGREGVTSKRLGFTTKYRWRKFSAHQLDRRGVLLLPDRKPLPWQYLRAVHVPWGPHQDQLLALVTHYMGPPITESNG